MRILVTGGAGFIGSNLVDRLLADGHEVIVVDDLSSGANRAARAEFHQLDVRDPALAQAADGAEVICHLAAQISVRSSVADPLNDARVNIEGTLNVLEAARSAKVRKVVFASSVARYGRPHAIPVPAGTPARPMSPYAASKVSAEAYLSAYQGLYGIEYTTLVLSNVFGPRQSPGGEAGVVAIFTDALLGGRSTVLYGDGSQTRDYVYVDDVVDAFTRACGPRGNGGIFNIGTGAQTSDRALHGLIAAAAGVPDDPELAPARLGDLPAMAVDPAPAFEGLGWRPEHDLAAAIKLTVDWVRNAQ
ncbi:NAD-dependent epimerase/dehydratase family protein [Herbidospora mongoliensis]|uniref:NAD-dependent epimerase/dehydratase family protein n=1 Tax=Herbidospora mongoliensis TaxID=688067 RepID=UPI0008301BC5|nr:NAD-dependent epimerase/dehydratase family protein [Herbidospora mongoliensis]